MHTVKPSKLRQVNKAKKPVYNPKGRYNTKRTVFRWVDSPIGAYVKAVLGAYAEHCNPSIAVEGNFKEVGLTKNLVHSWVTGIMPWLPEWFEAQSGVPLTPNHTWNRLDKQYRTKGKLLRTSEHYQQCDKLRPFIEVAEKTVISKRTVSHARACKYVKEAYDGISKND